MLSQHKFFFPNAAPASKGMVSSEHRCFASPAAATICPGLSTGAMQLVKLAAGILPIVFLSELAGGLNAACAGVMRGAGRQTIATVINGAVYWGIGLPLCM